MTSDDTARIAMARAAAAALTAQAQKIQAQSPITPASGVDPRLSAAALHTAAADRMANS